MMRKIVTKGGGTIYVKETACKDVYTAEKLERLIAFQRTKPIGKATALELAELVRDVLGKEISPKGCKVCTRNKYVTLLMNYMDVAMRILKVDEPQDEPEEEKDEEKDEKGDEPEKTEDTEEPKDTEEPTEEPKEPAAKPTKPIKWKNKKI